MEHANPQLATLAGGCFWCTEAIFKRLKGVISVTPGYTGGTKPNPTYNEVCSGNTGHAEATQIQFDPSIITYEKLLDVFFALHDPTTMNRQGNDVGTQYRSAIFYHNDEQKRLAQAATAALAASGTYANSIVTQITALDTFYPAETYHRDYYDQNRSAGYCRLIIDPKIQKLYKNFKGELKEDAAI